MKLQSLIVDQLCMKLVMRKNQTHHILFLMTFLFLEKVVKTNI